MSRNNPCLSSTINRSRAQPQYLPVRDTILYSTGPLGPLHAPQQLQPEDNLDVLACSDCSLSQHYQLVQPIESVDQCIADICARGPERKILNTLSGRKIHDLRKKIITEYWKYNNGRDGHMSLSTSHQIIEDAAAGSKANRSVHTNVSNVDLARLIREFSPKHTAVEIMPNILAWVGMEASKGERANKFKDLRQIIIDEILNIWTPSGFEPEESRGTRLLTRKDYIDIAGRLSHGGGELSNSEIYRSYNTIRGLDMLELLGRCLHHELVLGTDVTITSEHLSLHFCKPGVSFGLYTLFKNAGDKICRGNAEQYACIAVDEAAKALRMNIHSHEDHEFHSLLGRMLDAFGDIQRLIHSAGAPTDRPDDRPPRDDHRRQIKFVSDLFAIAK